MQRLYGIFSVGKSYISTKVPKSIPWALRGRKYFHCIARNFNKSLLASGTIQLPTLVQAGKCVTFAILANYPV